MSDSMAHVREAQKGQKRKNPQERFEERPTRKNAIEAKCFDCTCQQREEIRLCPMTDCPLYEFRPYK